jgi:hypothetical protein
MLGLVLASAALVIAITAALVGLRRRWPGTLAAWVVYLVVLAPLSGILPFGRLRGVADRYTYAACIGWAVVVGGAAVLGWRAVRRGQVGRLPAGVVGAGALVVLLGWSVLSWQQSKVWRDGVTLWGWALVIAPDSPVAHNNLAWVLAHAGEFARAETHARRAATAWPDHPAVLQTLARILAARGRLDEATAVLGRLVALAPNSSGARIDLGSVLYERGAMGPAVRELERAVGLDPGEARAHDYLGRALTAQGRSQEAEAHLRRAAELRGQQWRPADRPAPTPSVPAAGTSRPRRRLGRARGAMARRRPPARVGGS